MSHHQRKNAADWQVIINQQAASGQSISGFCKTQKLSVSNFYKWKSTLNKSSKGFTKLAVVKQPPLPGQIRCLLPNGFWLEWDETVSADTIITLLRTFA